MARLQYNHPADNLAALATLSLAGFTAQAAYPLANLVDLNPANPFKANEQTGRVIIDHGTAKAIALVALIHHNLDAALSVKFQANATDSWGAPSFSQAFTIGAKDTDGYRPNTYLDLSGAPPTFRYHSLFVEGTNTLDVILGELWLGSTIRTIVHNYSWGFRRADVRPGRKQWTTPSGVDWTYPSQGRRRGLTGSVDTSDAGVAALSAWSQAAGGLDQPVLIIPGAPDITDALLAKWTVDFEYTGEFIGVNPMAVGWLELARGVPWP